MRAFLAASDRAERERLAIQFALMLTATRGGSAEIKAVQKELAS